MDIIDVNVVHIKKNLKCILFLSVQVSSTSIILEPGLTPVLILILINTNTNSDAPSPRVVTAGMPAHYNKAPHMGYWFDPLRNPVNLQRGRHHSILSTMARWRGRMTGPKYSN